VALLFPRLAFADDGPALRTDGRELSYRQLASACAHHTERLASAGLSRGDRVGVFTHPGLETMVALVASALAGVVSVPLNPKLGTRELGHILRDAAPSRVYTSQAEDVARVAELVTADTSVAVAVDLLALGESTTTPPTCELSAAPLFILYTSGTTGAPKGAVLSSRAVGSNLDMLARAWRWTDEDRLVHALPLFHVHGLALGLFGSLRVGGTLEHLSSFSPTGVCDAMARGGSMLFAVPTMYHRLAEWLEEDAAQAIAFADARLLVSGSAALPLREHRRLEALLHKPVYERYGLTETLIDCAVPASADAQPGYVGKPLPGVELRLVDELGSVLDVDDDLTIGEVVVRGPHLFSGYLNRPDATAAVMDAEGFFHTGDLATRREDGSIRIVGRRATDLIKTGGFKVGAGEVEACLLELEGVAEVAVVGAPDDDLGQRIVAFVVPRDADAPPDAAELIDAVARELSPHKRPREVRFSSELPKNAMGKVMKRALLDALEVGPSHG